MRLADHNLRGRTVIGADGEVIGYVASIFLDDSWRLEALGISLRRDVAVRLGVPQGIFRAGKAEVPVVLVQSIGETVVLTVGVSTLARRLATSLAVPPESPGAS